MQLHIHAGIKVKPCEWKRTQVSVLQVGINRDYSGYLRAQSHNLVKQQAMTSANVDPDICHHVASLGCNKLTHCGLETPYGDIELGQHWLR